MPKSEITYKDGIQLAKLLQQLKLHIEVVQTSLEDTPVKEGNELRQPDASVLKTNQPEASEFETKMQSRVYDLECKVKLIENMARCCEDWIRNREAYDQSQEVVTKKVAVKDEDGLSQEQVKALPIGAYKVHWKNQCGVSYGIVGQLSTGEKWLACADWRVDKLNTVAFSILGVHTSLDHWPHIYMMERLD